MGSFTKDNDSQSETTEIPDPLDDFFAAPLDEAEFYKLHHWLKGIKNSSVFEVHGFLCALTSSPVRLPPSVYFPTMLRPDLPNIVTEEDLRTHMNLLMRLHNQIGHSLIHDDVFYPLIDFREIKDSDSPHPFFETKRLSTEQHEHLRYWCHGYLAALELKSTNWEELEDISHLLFHLKVLAEKNPSPNFFSATFDLDMTSGQINYLITELVTSLPALVGVIYDQSCLKSDHPKNNMKLEKTDLNIILSKDEQTRRNGLCPCDSGWSFVQCCAQKPNTIH